MTLPIFHSDVVPHTHGIEASPLIIGGLVVMAAIAGAVVYRLRKA